MNKDRLQEMWDQQREFMILLKKERNFPDFPIDLSSKEGQMFVKNISYECADELHEARLHLKNKAHRKTEINDVDNAAYLEELCDVAHYLIELMIASGFTLDDVYNSYMNKGEINFKRIKGDY